jgi:hypothetical protein
LLNFLKHSELKGRHAFLSPSQYHWTNYDYHKLRSRFFSVLASQRGVELHEFAHRAIELGIRLPDEPLTVNMYVNDGIDFGMRTEVALYYSENCFGHADTLGFQPPVLRISDLKTGVIVTKHRQLEVYAALFCLEYNFYPEELDFELRIYQHNEVYLQCPPSDIIGDLMDRIVEFDKLIEEFKAEEG